jgi:hypothetical protein
MPPVLAKKCGPGPNPNTYSNCWNEFSRWVCMPHRALDDIPTHTRAVHQPDGVGLQVSPRRRVVVAHPVLVEARLRLEPLTGEAAVGEISSGRVDAAERDVGGHPDLGAGVVRREDGPPDVVGADELDLSALDYRNRIPPVPDVLVDQGTGGLVVFGDAPPI